MFVKIAKLGSRVEEVMVEEGTTIGGALAAAGLTAEGYNIRLNRVDASVDTVLRNGGDVTNIVTLLPAIKGGK
jgi:sulfur carrier protein ThiS